MLTKTRYHFFSFLLNGFFAVLMLMVILACKTEEVDFYVSPSGNDSNPGSKDMPFQTIERAQQAVREVAGKGQAGDVTVWLGCGTYRLSAPLTFGSGDSGSEDQQVRYMAIKDESPVISGGAEIGDWKEQENGLWTATLPDEVTNTRELFIGEKRGIRARHPNRGYLRVAEVGEDRRTNFYFRQDDFPMPGEPSTVELVFLYDWSISRIAVKRINWQTHNLRTVDSVGAKALPFFNMDNWEKHPRYFLENSKAFLDSAWEWYLDKEQGLLYLQLPGGKNPNDMETVVPLAKGLMQLKGCSSKPISNLVFEGITFQHAKWNIPEMGYCGIQATHHDPRPRKSSWSVVPAAVKGTWIENCSFLNCRFRHLGTSGLWLSTGCKNCTVRNSTFADVAGNGIMVGEGRDREVGGEPWWQSSPGQAAEGNTIENSTVKDCGQVFYGAVGIWCGLTAQTTIRENEVTRLPYTGISVGWKWDTTKTPCRANVISGNHIYHVMQKLSDGGGIYMLGLQPESKVLNNRIHDVPLNAGRAESNGMFLDQGTTGVLIEYNLIYHIDKPPLRFHRATTNLVRKNNLFCSEGAPPIRYNNTRKADIKKTDNHIFRAGEEDYQSNLESRILQWTDNKRNQLKE